MKYNLESLEWQQFEILCFKCLQLDIAKSIQFIQGGSDKGRDIVYQGTTDFFGKEAKSQAYVFQVKHKSDTTNFSSIKADLTKELDKVFIKNKLQYDRYCLVTNLPITGNQFDELSVLFAEFVQKHQLPFSLQFSIYSYQHLESCIDRYDFLKWAFPSILKTTDFKYLLESLLKKKSITLSQGWLPVFEKNKEQFIYTHTYEKALQVIHEKNIVLLSGPPKAGKSFTAEMIALTMVVQESFTVYKLDRVDEFDQIYDQTRRQLFLFDDSFGKHTIDFSRSDAFDRKVEYILSLLDSEHKCIFTSREYIYKAFLGYSDVGLDQIISKILVEVSDLSIGEKDSIFRRYFNLKFPHEPSLPDELVATVIIHRNFAPETIRSFFENAVNFKLAEFQQHLNTPDAYLEKVFTNLTKEKRLVLLALLFSTDGSETTIGYCFRNVWADTAGSSLLSLREELDLLVGSIIKKRGDAYEFYHPSMFDFFVRYLGKDVSLYRQLLFRNFNLELLNLAQFKAPASESHTIGIKREDIDDLILGMKRFITNESIAAYEINSLLTWMQRDDFLLHFRLYSAPKYTIYYEELLSTLKQLDFTKMLTGNVIDLSAFFNSIRQLVTIKPGDSFFETGSLAHVLKKRTNESEYWRLVFAITPYLEEGFAKTIVTTNWLNSFYLSLQAEINGLGNELFGPAYPRFELLEARVQLLKDKNFSGAAKITQRSPADFKRNTNRFWYPRYKLCKEKMEILKNSKPFGEIIYNRLQPNFSPLKRLEDNQKNRYFFNTGKKWW